MAQKSKQRARAVSERSSTAQANAAKKAAAEAGPAPRWLLPSLYVVGSVFVAIGVTFLAVITLHGLNGGELGTVLPFSQSAASDLAAPAVMFLLAFCALIIAELMRRSTWESRDRSFIRGGSTATQMSPTKLRFALVWMLLPLVAWALLVAVPLAAFGSDSELGEKLRATGSEFWQVLQFYGFLMAAVFGIMVVSLVKRAAYALYDYRAAPTSGRTFWTMVSAQWRAESWLGAIGFGVLGIVGFLWQDALAQDHPFDQTAFTVLLLVAGISITLAVVTAANAWRSGEPFGAAESVA